MARPAQDNPRRKSYPLRLSDPEREALQAAAQAQGQTPADFLRAAFLAPAAAVARPPGVPQGPALDPAAIAALGRIGANLNQVVRRINAGAALEPRELPEVLAGLHQALDRIEALVFASIDA